MMHTARAQNGRKRLRSSLLQLAIALMFLLGVSPSGAATPCPVASMPQAMEMLAAMPVVMPLHVRPSLPCPRCPDQGVCCTFTPGLGGVLLPSLVGPAIVSPAISLYPQPAEIFLRGLTVRPVLPPPRIVL